MAGEGKAEFGAAKAADGDSEGDVKVEDSESDGDAAFLSGEVVLMRMPE